MIPRCGSVDGDYGFPRIRAAAIRVLIDGDMPRGVRAYNLDEGWADVLVYDEDGSISLDGIGGFRFKRVMGKIEVFEV